MTKQDQTYRTRVLTARDHQLVDALERDPRYAKIAATLRPGGAAPKRKASAPKAPAPEPKPEPKPEPGHVLGGMTTQTVSGITPGPDKASDPPEPVSKPVPKGKGD